MPPEAVFCYESFVNYTLMHRDNHWDSQQEQVTKYGDDVAPTIYLRFEEFNLWWYKFTGYYPDHVNASPSFNYSNYKLDVLTNKEQNDYALYNECIPYIPSKDIF